MPYIALHVWYVVLYVYPKALVWVQISQALQYLPFPIRVELNRAGFSPGGYSPARLGLNFAVTMLTLSLLMFGVLPYLAASMGPGAQSVWVIIA